MSSILTETTGNSVLGKQNRKPYIYSVIIMGFFTFLFLGAVYLYDNMISLMLSEKETVLAQNYALGVSTLGFLLYPVLRRFAKKQWRVDFLFSQPLHRFYVFLLFVGTYLMR